MGNPAFKEDSFCITVLGDYYLWGEYNEKPVYQHYRNTNFSQILTNLIEFNPILVGMGEGGRESCPCYFPHIIEIGEL